MTEQTPAAPDPFALWRDWVSQSERHWNAYLNQVMGTDQFNEAQNRMMGAYLGMQKTMSDAMGRLLTSLDMPTRSDVLRLGERLTVIEDRLRAIEERLGRRPGGDASGDGAVTAAVQRPARTRRPGMP